MTCCMCSACVVVRRAELPVWTLLIRDLTVSTVLPAVLPSTLIADLADFGLLRQHAVTFLNRLRH